MCIEAIFYFCVSLHGFIGIVVYMHVLRMRMVKVMCSEAELHCGGRHFSGCTVVPSSTHGADMSFSPPSFKLFFMYLLLSTRH